MHSGQYLGVTCAGVRLGEAAPRTTKDAMPGRHYRQPSGRVGPGTPGGTPPAAPSHPMRRSAPLALVIAAERGARIPRIQVDPGEYQRSGGGKSPDPGPGGVARIASQEVLKEKSMQLGGVAREGGLSG